MSNLLVPKFDTLCVSIATGLTRLVYRYTQKLVNTSTMCQSGTLMCQNSTPSISPYKFLHVYNKCVVTVSNFGCFVYCTIACSVCMLSRNSCMPQINNLIVPLHAIVHQDLSNGNQDVTYIKCSLSSVPAPLFKKPKR